MRRVLILLCTLLGLLAMLVLSWVHRYEATGPKLTLRELKDMVPSAPGVRWMGASDQPVLCFSEDDQLSPFITLDLSRSGAIEALHLKGRIRATGLRSNAALWSRGNMNVSWRAVDSTGSRGWEPIIAEETNHVGRIRSQVMKPAVGPAVPILWIGHRGTCDTWELSEFEIQPVRSRPLWNYGKWLLSVGAFCWLFAAIRRVSKHLSKWRLSAAALLILLLVTQLVFPGPWKTKKSLPGFDFIISEGNRGISSPENAGPMNGGATRVTNSSSRSTAVISPQSSTQGQHVTELPDIGDWILEIRQNYRPWRPWVHLLAMLVPTILFACIFHYRSAMILCVVIAVATELSQMSFGYGFNSKDVLDLVFDLLGVSLGGAIAYGFARLGKSGKVGKLPVG